LWAVKTAVAGELLQRATEYCQDNNIDLLKVSPPTFLDLDNIFSSWLRVDQTDALMAKPLSLAPLLQATLGVAGDKIENVGKSFLFLDDDEAIEFKIDEAGVKVTSIDRSTAAPMNSIVVRLSSGNLIKIIFGIANPYISFLTGQIKIQGIRNITRALKLLQIIRMNQPWTVAIADDR